jgi:hypothetical protein
MFSTAPATAATVEEIALLRSTERQKILVDGAKLPWFFWPIYAPVGKIFQDFSQSIKDFGVVV